jgi:hypothetical protein
MRNDSSSQPPVHSSHLDIGQVSIPVSSIVSTFIMESMLFLVLLIAHSSWAISIPSDSLTADLDPRQFPSCQNAPTSRECWGDYSIDTNYYNVIPVTGVTRGM